MGNYFKTGLASSFDVGSKKFSTAMVISFFNSKLFAENSEYATLKAKANRPALTASEKSDLFIVISDFYSKLDKYKDLEYVLSSEGHFRLSQIETETLQLMGTLGCNANLGFLKTESNENDKGVSFDDFERTEKV